MKGDILRVVLADDNKNDRLLFKEAFKDIGLNTSLHFVEDGKDLMEYLSSCNGDLPHMLFLDLNMPQKTGLQCLREIKSDKKLKDISVAIYSVSAGENDVEETFRNGANVYIEKPGDFEVLKQLLKKAVLSAQAYQSPPFNKANFLLRL
jgi:CheY-like chemotaxis protein